MLVAAPATTGPAAGSAPAPANFRPPVDVGAVAADDGDGSGFFVRQLHAAARRPGQTQRVASGTLSGLGPNDKLVVYGYTDDRPVGAALKKRGIIDNLDLSSRRADAVVRYLTSKGVNPSMISAKGRGDTHPAAPNDTPEGRKQNRRIEVVVEQPAG